MAARITYGTPPQNHVITPSTLQGASALYPFNDYPEASRVAQQIESLKHLIQNINKAGIPNSTLVVTLKSIVGHAIYQQTCAFISPRNLEDNARVLLSIFDWDGRNVLEQIQAHYQAQLDRFRNLNTLEYVRDRLSQAAQTTIRAVDKIYYQGLAKEAFEGLRASSPELFGRLCCAQVKADNYPSDPYGNYGEATLLKDIQKLHSGYIIQEEITQLKREPIPELKLVSAYTRDAVPPTYASQATIEETKKLYILTNLHSLLRDNFKSNDFVLSKYLDYKKQDKFLFPMLEKLVWMACNKPLGDLEFGKHHIEKDVRSLLRFANSEGKDIIAQLIDHQRAKIKALSIIDELNNFQTGIVSTFAVQEGDVRHRKQKEYYLALSPEIRSAMQYLVWFNDGGKTDPNFAPGNYHFNRHGDYGVCKTDAMPNCILPLLPQKIRELNEKLAQADSILESALDRAHTLPHDSIDVSPARILDQQVGRVEALHANFRAAFVTAEFQGVASIGGLGAAVKGMANATGPKTRIIMPLYENGVLNNEIEKKIEAARRELPALGKNDETVGKIKSKYALNIANQPHRVIKVKHKGTRFYFIENTALFSIPKKPDGQSAGNFYNADYFTVKRRWAVFQKAASDLAYKFGTKARNPVELVHVHDSQTALIPEMIAAAHKQEWEQGKTPAVVNTFHNNLDMNPYLDESRYILESVGLGNTPKNSFVRGFELADFVTTVSPNFGKEMQTKTFGNNVEFEVKNAAANGKFVGILNGNTIGDDFDPSKAALLRDWKRVADGTPVDLTFGPDAPDFADKIRTIKEEFCNYMNKQYRTQLDPKKPIVSYIGRFDFSQKGIDKLQSIMKETIRMGGQFICIGVEPDATAEKYLIDMQTYANARAWPVFIQIDTKEGGKFVHQSKFGSLLRIATDIAAIPSKFEPCCLVDGEALCMGGSEVLATRTGGLADKHTHFVFPRLEDWDSAAQNKEVEKATVQAMNYAMDSLTALYFAEEKDQKQFIDRRRENMRKGLNSTWEKTYDGSLSPIRRYEQVYARALANRKSRNRIPVNLETLKL